MFRRFELPHAAKEFLLFSSVLLGLFLLLPLLALFGLTLQFGFFAAIPVAVGLFLLWPRARRLLRQQPTERVRGVAVALSAEQHPQHAWLRSSGRRLALVGADDFLQRFVGKIDRIDLPEPGRMVKRGEALATVWHANRSLEIASPADGRIARINSDLRVRPENLNTSPYAEGWIAELETSVAGAPGNGLLKISEVVPWIRSEIDRLVALVSGQNEGAVGMADGGEVPEAAGDQLDDATWTMVRDAMFVAR